MPPMKPLAVAFAAAALGPIASFPAAAEVRVYDVDPQYRAEVYNALDQLFPDQIARLAMLPTGQILIDAEPDRQAEIEAVLETIGRAAVSATPSASLRYWVLFGTSGSGDGVPPPAILQPVIRELQTALGALSFSIVETASLASRSGEFALSQSATLELGQRLYINGSTLSAEIQIQTAHQELELQVTLDEGEFLVLGDTQVEIEQTRGTLVHVVHWPAGN